MYGNEAALGVTKERRLTDTKVGVQSYKSKCGYHVVL